MLGRLDLAILPDFSTHSILSRVFPLKQKANLFLFVRLFFYLLLNIEKAHNFQFLVC